MHGIQSLAGLLTGEPVRTGVLRGTITRREPPPDRGAWERLTLTANGLEIERADLSVPPGMDFDTGDAVLCWTGDAQTYSILCKVVSA